MWGRRPRRRPGRRNVREQAVNPCRRTDKVFVLSVAHRCMGKAKYKQKDVLNRLYWEEGLSQRKVAKRLDCSRETVRRHMIKHGIEPGEKDRCERISNTQTLDHATYFTRGDGYCYWEDNATGETERVYVHRLVAVAEFGFDAVAGNDVHHRNSISWDNRPSNLRVMSRSDHASNHANDRKRDTGRFV